MVSFDLNVPWNVTLTANDASNKASKKKGKGVAIEPDSLKGLALLSDANQANLRACLDMLIHLGYAVCALNLCIPLNAFTPTLAKSHQPCPGLKPPFPDIDPRTQSAKKQILQLSRLTVVLDEKSIHGGGNGICFTSSNANTLAQYDLLAVQPLDMPSFQYACTQLAAPSATSVDIITLDLATSAKLPFHLKRSLVLGAIQNGVVFEIVYGITLRPSSPAVPKDARRNVFASAKELVRITKGKGLILSSAVQACLELRAAPDLINLAHECMEMSPQCAKMALEDHAKQAVMRGHSNRTAFKGAIKGPVVVGSLATAAATGESSNQKKRAAEPEGTDAETAAKRARTVGPGEPLAKEAGRGDAGATAAAPAAAVAS